ncbi:MAG: hypothetical protein IPI30_09100 [Saprospiraceae bacterium]|nr:hypothetical protein [Candidatus Vicinibacter affinis]
MLRKEERFTVSELENGTHVVKLDVKKKNLVQFKDSLSNQNVQLNAPVENGFFLKINPTINRIQPENLAEIFLEALKK